jgi:hypothetical protein
VQAATPPIWNNCLIQQAICIRVKKCHSAEAEIDLLKAIPMYQSHLKLVSNRSMET